MNKIGLALSGGGVKGAVHAGVLHRLDELGIRPDIISGTSTGAIVGGLYASGLSGLDILNFYANERPYSSNLWLGKSGLLDTHKIRSIFKKFIKKDHFDFLDIPLLTVATNMLTGHPELFTKGSVIDAMLASASFPGVFSPMNINGQLYSDGGIMNHFPADLIREKTNFLIGVHLSPNKPLDVTDLNSTRSILSRAIDLQGSANEEKKLDLCDIAIFPEELINYSTFDFDKIKIQEMFELGYEYMKANESKLPKSGE